MGTNTPKLKRRCFFYTDTADSPWTVIKIRLQKTRALELRCAIFLHKLPYFAKKNLEHIGPLTPCWSAVAHIVYEQGEKDLAIL